MVGSGVVDKNTKKNQYLKYRRVFVSNPNLHSTSINNNKKPVPPEKIKQEDLKVILYKYNKYQYKKITR